MSSLWEFSEARLFVLTHRHFILKFLSPFSTDGPSQSWHSRIMFAISCSSAIIAVFASLVPDSTAPSPSSASHSPRAEWALSYWGLSLLLQLKFQGRQLVSCLKSLSIRHLWGQPQWMHLHTCNSVKVACGSGIRCPRRGISQDLPYRGCHVPYHWQRSE